MQLNKLGNVNGDNILSKQLYCMKHPPTSTRKNKHVFVLPF